MKRILVTGATGFVGCHLCRRLVRAGNRVVALVRRADRVPGDLQEKMEVVQGDLRDAGSLDRAVRDCDAICHLAALATAWDPDPDAYLKVNTEATGVLLNAAARRAVSRFVHVSTIAAVPAVCEPGGRCGRSGPTPYAVSKMITEELVRKYVSRGGDAVIVRPSRIYGPGPCNDANGATRMMALYLAGRFRFLLRAGGARANYVHVDDVARGIQLALSRGRAGAAYTLGGENATLPELLEVLGSVAGVRRRYWKVPVPVLLPVAHLGVLWGCLGGRPLLTPAWLQYFLEDRPQDITTSRNELGYAPRCLRRGITETVHWMMGGEGRDQNGHRFYKHLLESAR